MEAEEILWAPTEYTTPELSFTLMLEEPKSKNNHVLDRPYISCYKIKPPSAQAMMCMNNKEYFHFFDENSDRLYFTLLLLI